MTLGPITEARFAEAFAATALVDAKTAAGLVGLDPRTLRDMTDQLVIRGVRRGKLRAYTEADLRAYLIEGPDACREPRSRKARPAARSHKVIPFTERRSSSHRIS
jgi:hypothetical protein